MSKDKKKTGLSRGIRKYISIDAYVEAENFTKDDILSPEEIQAGWRRVFNPKTRRWDKKHIAQMRQFKPKRK